VMQFDPLDRRDRSHS